MVPLESRRRAMIAVKLNMASEEGGGRREGEYGKLSLFELG
jgi:hypothetical protein